jgi:hypothetical protein
MLFKPLCKKLLFRASCRRKIELAFSSFPPRRGRAAGASETESNRGATRDAIASPRARAELQSARDEVVEGVDEIRAGEARAPRDSIRRMPNQRAGTGGREGNR